MKARELEHLNQQLKLGGDEFSQHIATEVNSVITNDCSVFEDDF